MKAPQAMFISTTLEFHLVSCSIIQLLQLRVETLLMHWNIYIKIVQTS